MDTERQIIRKAMAYDLRIMIRNIPDADAKTIEAVIKAINDYIESEDQA